jgi:hypothetical protein
MTVAVSGGLAARYGSLMGWGWRPAFVLGHNAFHDGTSNRLGSADDDDGNGRGGHAGKRSLFSREVENAGALWCPENGGVVGSSAPLSSGLGRQKEGWETAGHGRSTHGPWVTQVRTPRRSDRTLHPSIHLLTVTPQTVTNHGRAFDHLTDLGPYLWSSSLCLQLEDLNLFGHNILYEKNKCLPALHHSALNPE